MKNILTKILVVGLSFAFLSCAPQNKTTQVRLVNLEGKYTPVITRVPELNAKALSSQEAMTAEKKQIIENAKKGKNKPVVKEKNLEEVVLDQQPEEVKSEDAPLVEVTPDQKKAEEINKLAENDEQAGQKFHQVLQDPQNRAEEGEMVQTKTSSKNKSIKKPILIKKNKKSLDQESAATQDTNSKESAITATPRKRGIFVQVGSFSDIENAKQKLNSMTRYHSGSIETSEGEKTVYRVLLGPFASKKKANIIVNKIKASGNDAIVVRNK